MSAIRSRNRPGSKSIPNWRMEDATLDAFDFRVACWLASHSDQYAKDHVTRNAIARILSISAGKVSGCLVKLEALGIVELETVNVAQSEGGKRLVITFDHAVWEIQPRSSDDQGPVTTRPNPGHDVTAPIGTHVENQESSSSLADEVEPHIESRKDQAQRITKAWWDWRKEQTGRAPIAPYLGARKVIEKVLECGYTELEVKQALTKIDTPSYSAFSRVLAGARPADPSPNSPMGILQAIANRDNQ